MGRDVRRAGARLAGVLALAWILGAGAVAHAGDAADPDSYRAYDVGDGRVTLDVQDAVFGQVVAERIQPRTTVNIFVAPEAAEQRVTLRVVDLHWVQALDAMVEKIGGVMVRQATNLLRIERPQPVTFSFTDEDVRKVIVAIADYSSASVMVAQDVTGTITLSLNEVPWRAALEQVVRTAGYALVEEDYGILRVVAKTSLELETTYYRFRYMRPPPPYKGVVASGNSGGSSSSSSSSSSGGSSGGGGGGSSGANIIQSNVYVPSDNPTELEQNFPIIQALRQVVAEENGDVRYIASQNALVCIGTRPKLNHVRDMLRELDVEPPQIFIDMNFIITSCDDALNLGLNAGENGVRVGFQGSDIIHMLPFNAGGGTGDLAEAITGTAFPSPAGSAFNYGALTTSQTDVFFQALQRDTSTRIVQAPKLLALDNQEATIFIGDSVPYARSTAATNQNGGLAFSVEEDPNSPVNVGFQLLIIPNVIRGEGKILMTVIPQRSALNGTTSPIIGFERITVSGQTIDLPRIQTSTMKTAMILRDGETAVIGGLLEDQVRDSVDHLPLLGDIPVLGMLFQGKSHTKNRQHLLITITPRILKGSDAANCTISDELAGRASTVATEWSDLYGHAAGDFPLGPCQPRYTPCAPPSGPRPAAAPTPAPAPTPPMPMAPSR